MFDKQLKWRLLSKTKFCWMISTVCLPCISNQFFLMIYEFNILYPQRLQGCRGQDHISSSTRVKEDRCPTCIALLQCGCHQQTSAWSLLQPILVFPVLVNAHHPVTTKEHHLLHFDINCFHDHYHIHQQWLEYSKYSETLP